MTARRNTSETSTQWRARMAQETDHMGRPGDILAHLNADAEKNGLPPLHTFEEFQADADKLLTGYNQGSPEAVELAALALPALRTITLDQARYLVAVVAGYEDWRALAHAVDKDALYFECPTCSHELRAVGAEMLFCAIEGPPQCPQCDDATLMVSLP